ncbi:helix-turn-helix domain-containing protein [Flagellimonas myxillae]|uniref:helix-turn-helix domain-containing protein n=1 Tax=Flagellimonas myxillae TaxID=2942214 RepID=UPI00201E93DB|nr:AraC family transcriptional regulator [Muricauda myxillae]MCL6265113.1 AraC family transcriptional regulator [Muricauda myxillae]
MMDLNIYNCLIIAGIIQGFIFSFLVFNTKKFRSISTRLLGFLVLAYSLGNLQYILPDVGLMTLKSMYCYVYLPSAALIPVLLYMYVHHFLTPMSKITAVEKRLLAPFSLFLLLTLLFRIYFVLNGSENAVFDVFSRLVMGIEIFSVLFAIVLLSAAIIKVFSFGNHHVGFNPKVIRTSLNWLKYTLIVIFLGTLLWAYLTYRNIFVPGSNVSYYSLWIVIAATIYWLGHVGIYKFGIIEQRKRIRAYTVKNNKIANQGEAKNEHVQAFQKLVVEEKAFLDPNLTLETVAHHLDLSSSHLSKVIKNELHTNYTDYVNDLRITEAKNYLKNPDFSEYTITAIGLEAGFNSKSAFYHVFKKATGKTPLRYKKEIGVTPDEAYSHS